jgi:hypothetical protein
MNMAVLILLGVIIVVLAVMKFNFDMKYTLPAIEENKDLSLLNKVCYGMVAIAFINLIFRQYLVFVICAVIAAPFLVYLNYKAFSIAIRKFLGK